MDTTVSSEGASRCTISQQSFSCSALIHVRHMASAGTLHIRSPQHFYHPFASLEDYTLLLKIIITALNFAGTKLSKNK